MASNAHAKDNRALLLHTHDLLRTAGAHREIAVDVPAPENIAIDVIGVPAGSPIHLELELQAVSEGILVSGTASVVLKGECARCLGPVEDNLIVDLTELYVYPESEATEEDEVSRIVDETIDLEPLIRDQVVLELPFSPLCRQDCAGLCIECGADLNANPEHEHEFTPDARWAGLQNLLARSDDDTQGE